MKNILIMCMLYSLVACNRNEGNLKPDILFAESSDTTYLDKNGDAYRNIGMIPDSLQTTEQIELKNKVMDVIMKHLSVKDNRMVFELSEKEFLRLGIPARFYFDIQKSLHDNNEFYNANGIDSVYEMVEDMKKEYRDSQSVN